MDQPNRLLAIITPRVWGFSLVILLAFTPAIQAATDIFSFQRGFVYPDTFEGPTAKRSIGSVFQNPAGLANATTTVVKTDTSQNFLGFDQYAAALVLPSAIGTLGIGYLNFSANDIPRSGAGPNNRPTFVENFGFYNHLFSAALGIPVTKRFNLGAKIQSIWQRFDTSNAHSVSFDLGATANLGQYFWIGVHSQHLISTDLQYENASASDTLDARGVAEFGVKWQQNWAKFVFDDTHHRIAGEWAIIDNFSLTADWVWNGSNSVRNSFGTILDFQQVAFQYSILNYELTGIDSIQHLFGIIVRLSKGPKK